MTQQNIITLLTSTIMINFPQPPWSPPLPSWTTCSQALHKSLVHYPLLPLPQSPHHLSPIHLTLQSPHLSYPKSIIYLSSWSPLPSLSLAFYVSGQTPSSMPGNSQLWLEWMLRIWVAQTLPLVFGWFQPMAHKPCLQLRTKWSIVWHLQWCHRRWVCLCFRIWDLRFFWLLHWGCPWWYR